MDLNIWQQLTSLKSTLIQLAIHLLEDKNMEREIIALDLLMCAETVNHLEEKCIKTLKSTELPRLGRLCEELEKKREKAHAKA